MKLVVLVLAYNEEETIKDVIQAINKKLSQLQKFESHVLVVDDGSTDKTGAFAQELGAIVLSHKVNMGVGKAFQTGLEHVLNLQTDILVNIDADRQFDPDEISLLIEPIINEGCDFVCGDRFTDKSGTVTKPENMSRVKYYGNFAMTKLVSSLTGKSFTDVSCGYRAYSRKAILMLNLTGKFSYTQESFIDLAFKEAVIRNTPVSVTYYQDRKSKVASNIVLYTLRTLKIIVRTYRDYRPMLFFSFLSIPPFTLSLIGGVFTIVHFITEGGFSPYKFIGFASIYLFSLAMLLWIVGFLADMFVRVRINQEKVIYLLKTRQ
ncbi:MAG: glycosyltransferase family 2 protein [Patescibacteria group bacterium]